MASGAVVTVGSGSDGVDGGEDMIETELPTKLLALLEGGRERAGRGPFAHGRARGKGFPS